MACFFDFRSALKVKLRFFIFWNVMRRFVVFQMIFLVWSLPRAQKVKPEKGLETDQPETSLTGSELNA